MIGTSWRRTRNISRWDSATPSGSRDTVATAGEDRRFPHERWINALGVDLFQVGEDGVQFGVPLKKAEIVGELVAAPDVVGVQEGDHLAASVADAQIPGGRDAGVAAGNIPEAVISNFGEHRGGAVRGAIVHHQAFQLTEVLREHAADDDANAVRPIMGRDNH